ncbi:hypothetical protein BV25DRAFT_1916407 [Artomyces pyxidatus]|uniref:Uncharacterized protein n=1 Tax=Artomyces pyxidatus TaxID=48021 RepID=A0ACB8T1V2_9AGAM|nr:hypothetical protein BV25DRAFT_1916407 [Artomyces pyxidatus]
MLRPAVVNQLDHGNPMETPREQHSAPPRAPPRPIWTPSYTRPVDPDYQEIRELLRGPFEGPHTQELERIAYHLCAALFWSEQVLAAPHWKETRGPMERAVEHMARKPLRLSRQPNTY